MKKIRTNVFHAIICTATFFLCASQAWCWGSEKTTTGIRYEAEKAKIVNSVFETGRKFNCDMILMYDDIGCKGMAGAQGLMEEEFRKHSDEFHICWMPHALMDCRTVSPMDARKAVNEYMTTILHEEPLDPTLLDFDDSEGW